MTRFQRPISASTKARQLNPDPFCQPMRPCSAIAFRCRTARERSVGIINLGEKGTDLRAVLDIIGGQRRRDDPAGVGIDTDVQFAPRPVPARTRLLDQPFSGATPL